MAMYEFHQTDIYRKILRDTLFFGKSCESTYD